MKIILTLFLMFLSQALIAQRDSTVYEELEEDSVFVYRYYHEKKGISCYNLAIKTKKSWFIDTLLFNDAVPYGQASISYVNENLKKQVLVRIDYGRDYEHSYGNGGGWGLFESGVIIYDLKARKKLFQSLYYSASGETLAQYNETEDSIVSFERTSCVVNYNFEIDSLGTITISEMTMDSSGNTTCVFDHAEGIFLLKGGKYVRKED